MKTITELDRNKKNTRWSFAQISAILEDRSNILLEDLTEV
jgi:hypothetical protein